jgi:GntR family transcriptional regulator/MocR family aminotransferase
VEAALADLLEDGTVERHVRRMRRIYLARRDTLCDAVEAGLGGVLTIARPSGGLAVWARARGVDMEKWRAAAEQLGVLLQTARRFTFDGRPRAAVRLGFAPLDARQLREAVRRLREALAMVQGR